MLMEVMPGISRYLTSGIQLKVDFRIDYAWHGGTGSSGDCITAITCLTPGITCSGETRFTVHSANENTTIKDACVMLLSGCDYILAIIRVQFHSHGSADPVCSACNISSSTYAIYSNLDGNITASGSYATMTPYTESRNTVTYSYIITLTGSAS